MNVFRCWMPLRNRIAGRLSGGEQQMMAIAATLMGNPALRFADEPSAGLAPIIVQRSANSAAVRGPPQPW